MLVVLFGLVVVASDLVPPTQFNATQPRNFLRTTPGGRRRHHVELRKKMAGSAQYQAGFPPRSPDLLERPDS